MDADPPVPPPEPNPFEPPHAPGGRPRRRRYRPLPVLGKVAGAAAVTLAGMIAFVGTCFPIGFATFALGGEGNSAGVFLVLACLIGSAVALLAAFGVFRLIFRSRSRELPPLNDEAGR